MNRKTLFAATALSVATILGTAAFAQTTTPAPGTTTPPAATPAPSTNMNNAPATTGSTAASTNLPRVEATTLEKGYRTSKVVGANVVNANNETIGEIDDLIITPGGKEPYAVVSVGGFLGIGDKLVVVPYSQFSMNNERMVLANATKESLTGLPEYTYAR